MATDYFSGGYGGQYNAGAGYYPIQQQPYGGQTIAANAPNYVPNFQQPQQPVQQQGFYNEPYRMNQQGYANYPPNYAPNLAQNHLQQFVQQPQVTQKNKPQSIQGATPITQRKNNENLPLEIRGGVVITNCHCAKKNGLQDHCGRTICKIENENKRRRQSIWHDPPMKDTDRMVPTGEANNIMINPAYNEYDQVVPSNAEPVPVAFNNYSM